MDEFPEFDRRVIESLRQPMEEGFVNISRARDGARFPSRFMLVLAMNPCPCGNFGSRYKKCTCAPGDLSRYRKKISGPIMDRIDLWITVEHVEYDDLYDDPRNTKKSQGLRPATFEETTRTILSARQAQLARTQAGILNAHLGSRELEEIAIEPKARSILNDGARNLRLSPRSYHRVLKVARTIADLEGSEEILETHVLEALQYRPRE